jgi:hypothetical protein
LLAKAHLGSCAVSRNCTKPHRAQELFHRAFAARRAIFLRSVEVILFARATPSSDHLFFPLRRQLDFLPQPSPQPSPRNPHDIGVANHVGGGLLAFRASRCYSLVLIIAMRRYSLRLHRPLFLSHRQKYRPLPQGLCIRLQSLVELFKRAQFRVDAGSSPTFEELNRSFGHRHSPGARLSYRRPLLSGRSAPSKIRTETLPQATSAYPPISGHIAEPTARQATGSPATRPGA